MNYPKVGEVWRYLRGNDNRGKKITITQINPLISMVYYVYHPGWTLSSTGNNRYLEQFLECYERA